MAPRRFFAHRKSGNFVRVSLSVSSRAMIDKPQISLSRVKYQPARDFRPFRCCVVLLFGWNFGFYALHNQGNEWRPHRSLSRNHTGSRVRIICKHCVICDDVVSLLAYASDWQAVKIINIKKIPPFNCSCCISMSKIWIYIQLRTFRQFYSFLLVTEKYLKTSALNY